MNNEIFEVNSVPVSTERLNISQPESPQITYKIISPPLQVINKMINILLLIKFIELCSIKRNNGSYKKIIW